MVFRKLLALFVLSIFSSSPTLAITTYEDGMSEYNSGHYTNAIDIWQSLAQEGNTRAQFNLGYMYEFGIELDANYDQAVKWYHRAAEQGHARSQNFLGWMYEMGKGVNYDPYLALKWLGRAAEQGHSEAISDFNLVSKRHKEATHRQYWQHFYDALQKEIVLAETRYEKQQATKTLDVGNKSE